MRGAALLALICFSLAGCAARAPRPDGPLRLGFMPNVTHAPALVALSQGLFGPVAAHAFEAGPAVMEALAAGALDAAYVGPVPALLAIARGAPVRLLSGAAEGGAVLVGRPGLPSLHRRTVAVPQYGGTQDVVLRGLLAAQGLRDAARGGSVQIVQVAPADTLTLFRLGQVDAALLPEPWGSEVVRRGGGALLLDWNEVWEGGRYPTAVLVAQKGLPGERLAALLQGHRQAIRLIQQDPEAALRLCGEEIARRTGKSLPEAALRAAFLRTRFSEHLDEALLGKMADLAQRAGYLRKNRLPERWE